MARALINIDYTNDFVNGALPCGEPAIAIEDEIVRITADFIKNGDLTILAIDRHEENDHFHPDTRLYPPHNINGTVGRELYGNLKQVYEENKGLKHVKWLDKTRYSAFCGTNLELLLRERNINELHLVGVCTDICVLHTAVDAYNKGFSMVVYERATASFNEIGHKWALEHFSGSLNVIIK